MDSCPRRGWSLDAQARCGACLVDLKAQLLQRAGGGASAEWTDRRHGQRP
jgi:hypothetical protein